MSKQHADKRSVATDALETLGMIIDENQHRDEIHLAVDPAIAGEKLYPGQDVGLVDGEARVCDKPLGIVDPFLKGPVHPGQRFWLVVYPRQITSLRHVWSHPSFPEAEVAAPQRLDDKAVSEAWIREFAASIPLDYSVVMEGARAWLYDKRAGGWGEYLCFGGLLEGESVPDEFWPHFERVTGETVEQAHRGSFFTCSC